MNNPGYVSPTGSSAVPRLGLFRNRVIPLCNYVVATEPLADAQLAAIGWAGRESLADMRVQFMYLRLTADNRIVFGGESSPYVVGEPLRYPILKLYERALRLWGSNPVR